MALNTYQNFMNSLRGLFGMGAKPEQAHYGGRVAPYDPEADLNRVSRENAMTDISRSMGPGIDADAIGKLAGTDPAQATALMQFFFGGQRAQDLAREQMGQEANKDALAAWLGAEKIKSSDWQQYAKGMNDIPLQREQLRAQANRERDLMKWMGLGQLKDKDIAGKKEITGMTETGKTGRTEMNVAGKENVANIQGGTARDVAGIHGETARDVQGMKDESAWERQQAVIDAKFKLAELTGDQNLERDAARSQYNLDLEKQRQLGRVEITGMTEGGKNVRQEKDIFFKQGEGEANRELKWKERQAQIDASMNIAKQNNDTRLAVAAAHEQALLNQEIEKQKGRLEIQGNAQTWGTGEREATQKFKTGEREAGQKFKEEEKEKDRDLGYYTVDAKIEAARSKLPTLSGKQYELGQDAIAKMSQQAGIKKMVPDNYEKALVEAAHLFMRANEGKGATSLDQIEPFLHPTSRADWEKWKAEQLKKKAGWLW